VRKVKTKSLAHPMLSDRIELCSARGMWLSLALLVSFASLIVLTAHLASPSYESTRTHTTSMER